MYPIPSECPVCGGELIVTSLECRECETSLHGRFITGPLSNLNIDQIEFVELFIRNEGKITRMEEELNLSYPTIRNKLHEIIRSLGYEPGESDYPDISEDDRRKILEDLEKGDIDYTEAMKLLKEGEA